MVRIRFEEIHYLFNKTGPLPIGVEADASDEAKVAKEPGGFDLSPLNSPQYNNQLGKENHII